MSQSGTTTGFEGWIMVLVDKDTGISRVGEIDTVGQFIFQNVENSGVYTLVLLSPTFTLSSVLSMVAAEQVGKVYQYFKIKGSSIPPVVHKGPNLEFSDPSQVSLQTDVANDADSDGIPDGMDTTASSDIIVAQDNIATGNSADLAEAFLSLAAEVDTDDDGITNTNDPDIDGDGIPNWFDADDDGNDNYDVFDLDANSDSTLDSAQKIGDHYFDEEVEYIAVQMIVEPIGGISRRYIKFNVKLGEGVSPVSIRLRSDVTLFDESQIMVNGESGEEAGDIWDRTLIDDGLSNDSQSDDGIYGRKIKLKTGQAPGTNQVVFLQVGFGSSGNEWFKEYPFTFPPLSLGSVAFSYSSSSQKITKSGTPFGTDVNGATISGYLWTVSVYNASTGGLVHQSPPLEGAATSYTITESLSGSVSYSAIINAQSLDRVTSHPVYVIKSAQSSL